MVHIRRKEPNAMSSSECKKVLSLTIVSTSLLMGFSFVNWFFCRVKHSLCENERHYKKDCALSYSDHYLKDI